MFVRNVSKLRLVPLASTLAVALFLLISTASRASEVTDSISWTGSDGYTMTGTFSYSSSLTGWITGAQVDALTITGFENGTEIGTWSLSSGYAGYSFNFNFDVTTLEFGEGGDSASLTGQDWNDTYGGTGCPTSGIGFSSGSGAQGLCTNGRFNSDSMTGDYNLTASPYESVSSTPEPSTLWLMLTGGGALLGSLRRRCA
jgi:hypothetical protein